MRRTSTIGRHLPVAGGLENTLKKAIEQGCETLQVFVSNPQSWAVSLEPRPGTRAFVEGVREAGISPVVVHSKYLINLAAPDNHKRERSIETLAAEISAAAQIGADMVVVHSGSHVGAGVDSGIARLTEGIVRARSLAGDVVEVVLENSVGGGSQLCAEFKELARAADLAGVRVCLDTAHAFAAGYDLVEPAGALEMMREELGARIALFHLNDARHPLGGKRDGHSRIGEGRIPPGSFRELFISFPKIPAVMETPYDTPEVDAWQIRWVKELAGEMCSG